MNYPQPSHIVRIPVTVGDQIAARAFGAFGRARILSNFHIRKRP
jgi:hypothetical protein